MTQRDGFELVWPGKYDARGRRAALPETGATLHTRERFGDPPSLPSQCVILGDNLLALEALVREHPGSVDLVYIDPPFATGNQFSLVRRIGNKRRGDQTELRLPAFDDAFADGPAGLVRMLDPRLRLIHALLSPRGSLYVHVDPTVGHAIKLLLDEIFGCECFQREIIWRIGWVSGFKTRARNWIRNHDSIYFYTKHPTEFTFNKRWIPHPEGYQRREGAAAKAPGMAIEDVWNASAAELELQGRESLDSIQIKSFSREKTGWATQKNESVLRRIIDASSNPGDLVADLFGGSGTTAAVAHALGRRFLVSDHSEAAVQITRARLREAGVADFSVCVLDEAERLDWLRAIEREHGHPSDALLIEWMLAQLDAEPQDGPLSGRRGEVGVLLGLPGRPLRDEQLRAASEHARRLGLRALELLAWDWEPTATNIHIEGEPEPSRHEPERIELQVARAFMQPSVRATSWRSGGVAVWERPRVRVVIERDGSAIRVHLRALELVRPECLPQPLRDRSGLELLLGWSLVEGERVRFECRRDTAGELGVSSDWLVPSAGSGLTLALDDVRGHRCLLTIP